MISVIIVQYNTNPQWLIPRGRYEHGHFQSSHVTTLNHQQSNTTQCSNILQSVYYECQLHRLFAHHFGVYYCLIITMFSLFYGTEAIALFKDPIWWNKVAVVIRLVPCATKLALWIRLLKLRERTMIMKVEKWKSEQTWVLHIVWN